MTARDDHGFTLVELMLTVALLGIVMAPIGAAFVVGLRSSSDAASRLTESRGAQITAAFFARDVQGARTVTLGSSSCGAVAGTTPVLTLSGGDPADPTVVTYQLETLDGQRALVRDRCAGAEVVNHTPVAHDVSGTPTVSCSPSCAAVSTVSMHVEQSNGYAFDVHGTRRAQ
jgi:prepilin-type N-terminal cleavage/methylation domain-containing protein